MFLRLHVGAKTHHFGAMLGRVGAKMGYVGANLGYVGAKLGYVVILAHLGAILEPSWSHLGPTRASGTQKVAKTLIFPPPWPPKLEAKI